MRGIAGILCHMTTETAPSSTSPWVPSDETFAARLAMVRHRQGWNMKEAARACGVPAASWRQWEVDEMIPRNQVTVAKQIATVAGCDFQWLLLGPEGRSAATTRYFAHERVISSGSGRVISGMGHPSSSGGPRGPVISTRPIAGVAQRVAGVVVR